MKALEELLSAVGGTRSLQRLNEEIRVGRDPGYLAVQIRKKGRAMPSEQMPTLEDFHALQDEANALAERICRGQAWIEEAEAKLPYLDPPQRHELATLTIPSRKLCLQEWEKRLDALEAAQVEAWRHYLRAQPKGRILVETRKGSIYLSAAPIMNSPHPVWLPEDICILLRIKGVFNPELFQAYTPEEIVGLYGEIDPLEVARKALKRHKRRAAPSGTVLEVDAVAKPTLGSL